MGVMIWMMNLLFGTGRNVVTETFGQFSEHRDTGAERDLLMRSQALAQFAAEFGTPKKGLFDRVIDGLNRLPRPILAFGTVGLFVTAMTDPVWFASRMQGIALVPEPLWWLMGAIISFYFGARHQAKSQDFQASILDTAARVPEVAARLTALSDQRPPTTLDVSDNAALADWSRSHD